ncbi:MAG: xanthine dehydrogenase molybdopterin binding subunit, partial [Betaproteobacteria bacterium]|nr:xanthine dehydrogenase molybdopterin binding subunit [Betaproteobacteria bacterium]
MNDRAAPLINTFEPGTSVPHESAEFHVSGEAIYADDIPQLAGTVFIALGLSERAHARIATIDLTDVTASTGVIDVVLAEHIPGPNNCGP